MDWWTEGRWCCKTASTVVFPHRHPPPSLQGPKISHRANSDRAPAAIDPSRFHAADWSEAISVPQTVCVLLGGWQRAAAETSHCWLTVWTPDIEAESIHNVMLQSPLICLFSLHLAPRLWTAAQSSAFLSGMQTAPQLLPCWEKQLSQSEL